METLLGLLLALILIAGIFIYSTLSWGFVLYRFWYWFLLPVFPDMPHVTLLTTIGLAFLVGAFVRHQEPHKETTKAENKTTIMNWLIAPWISLFFGWIIHLLY